MGGPRVVLVGCRTPGLGATYAVFVDNSEDRQQAVVVQLYGEPVPYRVVAFTHCLSCDRCCVLGERTVEVVESGQAKPICLSCATGVLRPEDYTGEVIDP